MKINLLNKIKWYLKNIFLFVLNPYLSIKNKFDFDFLNALHANKKLIKENSFKYQSLSVELVKKLSFDNENKISYSSSTHLNKVKNAEYFKDMQSYGYGERIINAKTKCVASL